MGLFKRDKKSKEKEPEKPAHYVDICFNRSELPSLGFSYSSENAAMVDLEMVEEAMKNKETLQINNYVVDGERILYAKYRDYHINWGYLI